MKHLNPGLVAQLVGTSSSAPKGCMFDFCSGTYLGCGFSPWLGCLQEATQLFLFNIYVPLSLSSSFSKINKYILG